jgi:hypothetical protein
MAYKRLTDAEANVVDKITAYKKIDWLYIDNDNKCRDMENNRVCSPKTLIKQLIEGMEGTDLDILTNSEKTTFLSLIAELLY